MNEGFRRRCEGLAGWGEQGASQELLQMPGAKRPCRIGDTVRRGTWMRIRLLLICLTLFAATAGASANSVPDSGLSEGGAPVPISRNDVEVVSERLLITFPPAGQRKADATVRAEYILELDERVSAPRVLDIGFPISYPWMRDTQYASSTGPLPRATVTRDGHAVAVRFLNFETLARPTVNEWRRQIDEGLRKFPELRKLVLAARQEGKARGEGWLQDKGWKPVRAWLIKNGGKEIREPEWRSDEIARGLVGLASLDDDYRLDEPLQEALAWLNPKYKKVYLTDQLSREWGHQSLLLNPEDGRLFSTDMGILFGVLQFRIELAPHKQHTLVVDYQQPLGFAGSYTVGSNTEYVFQGFRYIMANADKWRNWGETFIEIRIPKGWGRVGLRPPAPVIRDKRGTRIYRIRMGMPVEDLYVSAMSKATLRN